MPHNRTLLTSALSVTQSPEGRRRDYWIPACPASGTHNHVGPCFRESQRFMLRVPIMLLMLWQHARRRFIRGFRRKDLRLAAMISAALAAPALVHFRAGAIDHHNAQLVLLLGFLLLGTLRTIERLHWRMDQLEATTPSHVGRSGLRPGKKAPHFTLPGTSGGETAPLAKVSVTSFQPSERTLP